MFDFLKKRNTKKSSGICIWKYTDPRLLHAEDLWSVYISVTNNSLLEFVEALAGLALGTTFQTTLIPLPPLSPYNLDKPIEIFNGGYEYTSFEKCLIVRTDMDADEQVFLNEKAITITLTAKSIQQLIYNLLRAKRSAYLDKEIAIEIVSRDTKRKGAIITICNYNSRPAYHP